MSEQTTFVSLEHPLFRSWLRLTRIPKYLRFTCHGIDTETRTWDALDRLDDEAEQSEFIIAAILSDRGSLHIDKRVNGRRVGEWHQTAHYLPIEGQPSQEVLRDNDSWRDWCMKREEIEVPE